MSGYGLGVTLSSAFTSNEGQTIVDDKKIETNSLSPAKWSTKSRTASQAEKSHLSPVFSAPNRTRAQIRSSDPLHLF